MLAELRRRLLAQGGGRAASERAEREEGEDSLHERQDTQPPQGIAWLGGVCLAGRCKCDAAFTGPNCAALNLRPASRAAGYQPAANGSSSWGGNPVLGPDGLWHFFGSEFTNGCDVGQWVSNSQVIRATSTHPSGPFGGQS